MNLLLTGACGRGKWLALFVLPWGNIVAKSEWGTKRSCPSCGARFYDLRRSPVQCPKCDTKFDPDQGQRSRRPNAPPPKISPEATSGQVNGADAGATDSDGAVAAGSDESDTKDGAKPIEDTSELGQDEDDVSAVRGRGAADKASD